LPENNLHNEQELLKRVAESDQVAFSRVFEMFRNDVYMHALTYSKSAQFSEELVLDIFLKVWNNRQQLDAVNHFRNYLFILSKNHIISAMRKRLSEGNPSGTLDELTADMISPSHQMEIKEAEDLIRKAIDGLPPQQKLAFTLSRVENKTYDEIASIMGITKRTVNFHIVQALNTLRIVFRNNSLISLLFTLVASPIF
jgi:RNA polymerase sigma-70 factor (family 1)